jgi:hypothetical protein
MYAGVPAIPLIGDDRSTAGVVVQDKTVVCSP